MLPIPDILGGGFWDAVTFAQNHPGESAPLTQGGTTLSQYKQENLIGESLTGTRPGSNPGLANQGYGKPASPNVLTQASGLYARQTVARNVTTIKQSQDYLKNLASRLLPRPSF